MLPEWQGVPVHGAAEPGEELKGGGVVSAGLKGSQFRRFGERQETV